MVQIRHFQRKRMRGDTENVGDISNKLKLGRSERDLIQDVMNCTHQLLKEDSRLQEIEDIEEAKLKGIDFNLMRKMNEELEELEMDNFDHLKSNVPKKKDEGDGAEDGMEDDFGYNFF